MLQSTQIKYFEGIGKVVKDVRLTETGTLIVYDDNTFSYTAPAYHGKDKINSDVWLDYNNVLDDSLAFKIDDTGGCYYRYDQYSVLRALLDASVIAWGDVVVDANIRLSKFEQEYEAEQYETYLKLKAKFKQ